jgi:hypothetical protein
VRTLVAMVALGLVVAPHASAKLCATVTTAPRTPVAGSNVEIRLVTWTPVWRSGARATFGGYSPLPTSSSLVAHVVAPGSSARTVRLHRDLERPWLWRARFAFTVPGVWKLRPDDRRWAYAPRTCAPVTRVRVQ